MYLGVGFTVFPVEKECIFGKNAQLKIFLVSSFN